MATYPDYSGNSCASISDEEREKLWQAACTLVDERGLIVRITNYVGQAADWAGGKAARLGTKVFGDGWQEKLRELGEEALWQAHDLAVVGLDPAGEREPWLWFNKLIASATGAAGGMFGFPGLALDVPLSTLMIMRSIAEIARANGEDIGSDEGKRACLEVIAFGGPGTEDDDAEVGYWSTRTLFMHATMEMAIRQAAARLGVALSEKAVAQVVPVAGAFAGAGLNYLFMDFYQQMARVHFAIRAIERAHGGEGSVRACFDQLARQARDRRRPIRPAMGVPER